ncbi:hypothetical protein ABPG75_012892 [Micractinium tetrahymenae]
MEALGRDVLLRVLGLCACRDVLALACTCREMAKMMRDDEVWRELAEHKWGPAVRQLAAVQPGQWAAWVKHRLSTSSSPLSPLDLVQEHCPDPFQHLVACVLCSRTTGGPLVRQAIQLFLELYPTPTDVLGAEEDSLLVVMRPLGLPATRLAAVRGIAHDFLATDWQDPSEFKHCGKFVSDSWRIFCRGHRSVHDVEDKNLQRWLRWRLCGSTETNAEPKQRQRASAKRKRAEEKPAEAGTLRSGRRRSGEAAASRGARPAGERRVTRAAAAAGVTKASAAVAGKKPAGAQKAHGRQRSGHDAAAAH